MFGKDGILSVIASLIGATSLLLNAKGNPIGQALGVIFSILYAIISFSFAYYGEMITYLGLTGPMALAAFISWIRNPFAKGKAEVKVNHIHRGEVLFMFILTAVVTVVFYFVLDFFNTQTLFRVPFPSQRASSPYISHSAATVSSLSPMPQMI